MNDTSQPGSSVLLLLLAIDRRDHEANIKACARFVLRRAYDFLFDHYRKDGSGFGPAMCSILVARDELTRDREARR